MSFSPWATRSNPWATRSKKRRRGSCRRLPKPQALPKGGHPRRFCPVPPRRGEVEFSQEPGNAAFEAVYQGLPILDQQGGKVIS